MLDRDGADRARAPCRRGGARRRAFPDPLTTPDPQALAQRLRRAVRRARRPVREGRRADARAATGRLDGHDRARAGSRRRDVVIALGPWSDDLARAFGLRLPFFVKRGYHMHYEREGQRRPQPAGARPREGLPRHADDAGPAPDDRAPNSRGRDDPPSSAHLDRLEPFARELFPIGARQGRRALARPAPLPARHAPGHRARSRASPACGSISATSISA